MDGNFGRRKKSPNPPEGSPDKKMRRKDASGAENSGESSASSIAERLVEIYKTGGNLPPVFTQETSDNVKLKQTEVKCASLEETNKSLQMKLATSDAKIVKLDIELKNEEAQQKRLMNKMTTIWDYMKNITETINYTTESLDECKEHSSRLTSEYSDVITKLYVDNNNLKNQVEHITRENRQNVEKIREFTQRESELADLKPKYQILIVEVESYKKKLQEIGESERCMQKKLHELEATSSEEKRKLELMYSFEQDKLIQQRQLYETQVQKILEETEKLKAKAEKLQEEKNDVFRLFADKEEELKDIKKALDDQKFNVEQIQAELSEKIASYNRVSEEKEKSEMEIQEKNKQISQLTQQLEVSKLDLSKKTQDLTNIEEAKRNLEQEMIKKEFESQETKTKYDQEQAEWKRQIETIQKNLTEKNRELEELQEKWKEAVSENESIKAELSKSTSLLQAVQKENGEINHKFRLMSSTKEGELGDLRYQLDCLKKEMQEKQLEYNSETQVLKIQYEEIYEKYQNEVAANKEMSENSTADSTALNAQLQELKKLNKQYLKEKESLNKQFNTAELKLKRITKTDEQLKEKLKAVTEDLKISEQTIDELKEKNQQLDGKNKELMKIEKKLKTAEEKAVNFEKMYHDVDADLTGKIKKLQRDLDAAKLQAEQANKQRSLMRSESFREHHKNLEAAEKKAREYEERYNSLRVLHETERKRAETQQKLLVEAEKKAKEFEEKHKRLEIQGLEFNRKMSGLERSLQDPQVVSPSSWKKDPPAATKKVVIRSDQIFPPGTIESMQPPQTPKTPKTFKQPPKSILKTPTSSPRASPVTTPKSNTLSTRRVPSLPKPFPKDPELVIIDESTRSSSPDSSMIPDEFDMNVKKILDSLAEEVPRKSPAPKVKCEKKFFKSRNSQPK